MVRFDPADLLDDEIPAVDPRGEAPVATWRRRSRRRAAPSSAPANPLLEQAFPSWARPPKARAAGLEASRDAAFHAGASLALFDTILREKPPFAGALRQRLALRAAAAADLLDLSDGANVEGFADAAREIVAGAKNPLAAAAGAIARAMKLFRDAPAPIGADVSSAGDKPDVEIFALWLADLALARRLGWDAAIPLLATTIARASLRRGPSGARPRPTDPHWVDAAAGAYAMAAGEACALAGELARASERLLAVQPKLRAKGAGRVVELLLDDDAVSPARAAKLAGLSDRAARRLFDRLIELGAARELSGRPSFRLYGL